MLPILFTFVSSKIKYGIMCDAGSSGTRAYIYTWESGRPIPNVHPPPDIAHSYRIKLSIPISTAVTNIDTIETIFSQILNFCKGKIPEEYIEKTRFFVFASAGMRLLPQKDQTMILDKTYEYLREHSPYKLKRRYIRVISGVEEGVYAWISVNYLLGNLENNTHTVGALDMGGASFQIAIEIPRSVKSASIHKVSVGQKNFNLFAHSYLGYGVDEGLRKISRSISAVLDQSQIQNPCVQNGFHTKIESIDVEGTGNFSSCSRLTNAILLKSVEFTSISVPNLEYIDRFVAMSSIFYTNKFFNLSRSSTLKELKTQVKDFCQKNWSLLPEHITNNSFSPTYCWKGTYQFNLLSRGYNFKDSNVVIDKVNKINGVDLSWTVGSMLSEITEIEIDDQEKLTILDILIAALSAVICCIIIYIAGFKRFNWLYARKTRKML